MSLIKEEIAPKGIKKGEIRRGFKSEDAAFLFQNPEMQIVTDKVWHELAFACENRGWEQKKIRRAVAETAEYFGLGKIFRHDTDSLSGGQKQLVNLAAACVTNPKLLILDEPASMLDPLSGERLMDILKRMNEEFGTTIILSEHNTENIYPFVNRTAYMEKGKIVSVDNPQKIAKMLKNSPMLGGLPCGARLGVSLGEENIPLSNRAAREFLQARGYKGSIEDKKTDSNVEIVAELKNADFRYERNGAEILRGVSLKIHKGEILSVVGENGGGKSTLLSVMSGLLVPQRGEVKYLGKNLKTYKSGLYRSNIALLPQDPTDCFTKDSLLEEWKCMAEITEYGDFSLLLAEMGLEEYVHSHPYDLSGGEQQRAALGKVLMQRPKLLLLDEPCKGLDAVNKAKFKNIIRSLSKKSTAVMLVTHDLELAAELSHRCAFLFDGEIVSEDTPRRLFGENAYYTTSAVKISRNILEGCITAEDMIHICRGDTYEK